MAVRRSVLLPLLVSLSLVDSQTNRTLGLEEREGHHPLPDGLSVIHGVGGALQKLDQQFLYLLSHIISLIDPTVSSLLQDCRDNFYRSQSYGWSLVAGGALDTASDFFGNSR